MAAVSPYFKRSVVGLMVYIGTKPRKSFNISGKLFGIRKSF